MKVLRGIFTVIIAFMLCSLVSEKQSLAERLMVVMNDDTSLKFEYCWVNKEKIKFNVPGGTASIPVENAKAIEEIIKREEIDVEALKKMAVTSDSFDPLAFLANYAKTTAGLSVKFSDNLPQPKIVKLSDKPLLLGPSTRDYMGVEKVFKKGAQKATLLVAVFFNSREPIDPNGCYVQMLDMDENPAGKYHAVVKFVEVPIKQRVKKKITKYSYVAYALIPANKDYWAYEFKLTRIYWENTQKSDSRTPEVLEN